MPLLSHTGFDSAVLNREDNPVALIQVTAETPVTRRDDVTLRQMAKFYGAEFLFRVDLKHIDLYKPERDKLGEPILRLDTCEMLQLYDPEIARKRVFEDYLVTLVEAWLHDLAYNWKSKQQPPPGAQALREADFLEKIEGGTTQRLEN